MCASRTYLFNANEPLALTPNIHPLHSDWFKRLGTDRPCNYLATSQSAGRIGVGMRTWSASKSRRAPFGQYELFVPDSRLQTFN